jgi:hypothetical protein
MGMVAGVVSLLIVGRLAPYSFRGLSLVLSPLCTGLAMHLIGRYWRTEADNRPTLFSFRGGAAFAFGMALVRFIYLELEWRPF